MELLKKFKKSFYAVSVIYILIGLIMFLNPHFVSDAVNYVIGGLVVLYGIVYVISLYQKKDYEEYGKFDLLAGVFCISFGLFLILNKDILISLIPFCLGVILLMDSITGIIRSLNFRKLGMGKWWISLIINILFLGFSLYFIIMAKEISELFIRIIGVFLVLDAILDITTYIILNKYLKKKIQPVKAIEAQIEE